MYRSVLVPLDGSHRSEWALPGAIGIARRQTAQIELMIVEPVIPVAPRFDGTISDGAEPWRNEADSAWLTYVTGIAERVKAVYPATVTSTVRVGRAGIANEIVQHAYDTGTELIVMTTHGYGRFKRFWLGSVADAVIRLCRIPVLLMRPRDQARIGLKDEPQFRNILILLDGSSVAESIFDHAFAIGGTAAQYTLFHALPLMPVYSAEFVMAAAAVNGELRVAQRQSAQATLDQAATRLRQHDARLQVRTEVSSDDFAAGAILDYAEQNHVDLIALTTHGAGGVVRLMLGSVADKITRGAEVPVLLYRPA